MLDRLPALAAAHPDLARRGRGLTARFLVEAGERQWLVEVREGRIDAATPGPLVMPAWDFALRGTEEGWAQFWRPAPPPGSHDLMALVRRGALSFEGDIRLLMAHLQFVKDVLALPRPVASPATPEAVRAHAAESPSPGFEPIVGRYLGLDFDGRRHRLFVEEAGQGIPLLCLHTAGSDSRQWRGVMNDPWVLARFRVVAFDLPGHGRSSPPPGWPEEEHRLTRDFYAGIAVAVADALELARPVAMGCSIGGRVVLELALRHPDRFRAVVGLQSSAHVAPYYDTQWLHHPEVHGGEACAAVVSGLVGPSAPEAERAETLWHYAQGGPGVFRGDLHYYKVDGDLRDRLGAIDAARCPVHLLTGEYDYSCTPEDSRAVAERVPGATFAVMPGLGHFPMSEDPPAFLGHLRPVLERIAAAG